MATELQDAIDFAKKAHEGHLRKYTGDPYITHPVSVERILRDGHPSATLAQRKAAILHDVVEDTPHTIEDIEKHFGYEVAVLVDWLTDVSKPEDGNRKVRKAKDREHTAAAPPDAQIIKVCDLIHNSASILHFDKNFARVYLKEKRLILDSMRREVKMTTLWKLADNIIKDSGF